MQSVCVYIYIACGYFLCTWSVNPTTWIACDFLPKSNLKSTSYKRKAGKEGLPWTCQPYSCTHGHAPIEGHAPNHAQNHGVSWRWRLHVGPRCFYLVLGIASEWLKGVSLRRHVMRRRIWGRNANLSQSSWSRTLTPQSESRDKRSGSEITNMRLSCLL